MQTADPTANKIRRPRPLLLWAVAIAEHTEKGAPA